jgi:hypothetical protein
VKPTGSRPSSQTSRLIGWTLGAVVAVSVLGFLVAAGVVIWIFEVALPRNAEERAEAERELARAAGAAGQVSLSEAVRDGRLTDDEIAKAVGGPMWDVQRSASSWLLRAEYPGTDPICYSYEVRLPLGPDSRVTSTELPECPTITPG